LVATSVQLTVTRKLSVSLCVFVRRFVVSSDVDEFIDSL
jgi:hypothetical protein